MRCPDEGLLIAYWENQLTQEQLPAVENHLASCRICQRRLQVMQDEINFCRLEVAPLLKERYEAPVSGQYRVWEQIEKTCTRHKGVELIMKMKKVAVAAVVVLALVGLLAIPSVKAVADNLLQVFRVNEISTVTLGPEDITKLQAALAQGDSEVDLEKFGQIKTLGQAERKQVSSLDQLPFAVKLPANNLKPDLYVEDMPDAELKLNVANVNQLLNQLGSKDKLPETLDGQTFRMVLPLMVTADYKDFKLMQGSSPEIQAPAGVDIEQIRNAVINLPIWSPEVRLQLSAIQDWQHTLIIPDDGSNNTEEVMLGSNRGVFMKGSGSKGALMWQQDGRLFILEVASGGSEQAIAIAKTLR